MNDIGASGFGFGFGWGWMDVAKMIFVLFARSVSQLGIEMIWVRVFRRWVY